MSEWIESLPTFTLWRKKKSQEIGILQSILNERNLKIQELTNNEIKFIVQLSTLQRNNKLLQEINSELKSSEQSKETLEHESDNLEQFERGKR